MEEADRKDRSDTLIVVPAYNEASNLPDVLAGLARTVPQADILVVDDGSRDRTARTARRRGARVVRHPYNMGYGVAIQTGLKYALSRGYRYAVTFDGDGQHEPKSVEPLLEVCRRGEADLAVGNRFAAEGAYRGAWLRRAGIRLFGGLATLVTRQRVSDPTSGFRAFNRRAMLLYCRDEFPDTFPDADAMILMHRAGLKVAEHPVVMYPPPGGRSMHAGHRAIFYTLNMLLSIFFQILRRERSVLGDGHDETEGG